MGDFIVRAVLPSRTGLVRDQVVNDFAFTGVGTTAANCLQGVKDFYTLAIAPDNFPLSTWLSAELSRAANACTVSAYALDTAAKLGGAKAGQPETQVGSPVAVSSFTLAAGAGGNALPSEVAACLSFSADLTGILEDIGTSRPRARRRGRIFFGPLDNGVGVVDVNGAFVPKGGTAFSGDLLGAAVRLRDSPNHDWGVWSRADAVIRPITHISWVDVFATQRRRGHRPTVRTGV